MSDFRHVVKGSAYLATGAQIAKVVNFVQLVVLTKHLGSAGYGAWSLLQAIPNMMLVLTDMGINSLMLRVIARDKSAELESLQRALGLKLILAPIYLASVLGIALASGHDAHLVYLTTLFAVSVVASTCGQTLICVWRAQQRFGLEAKITLVKDVAISLLLIIANLVGWDLEALVWISIVHGFTSSVVLLRFYLKQASFSWKWSSCRVYFNELRAATPFAIYGLLSPLAPQIALVMLGSLSTLESVGIYNAAFRCVVFFYFIPQALQRTLLPRLSKQYISARSDFVDTLNKALRLVIVIGAPAAVGLSVTSRDVVALCFPAQFAPAGPVLSLLCLSVPLYYVRVVMNTAMYAANREKLSLLVTAGTIILNALMNWLLIPRFGSIGAAYTTLAMEAVTCASYCFFNSRDYPLKPLIVFSIKTVVACGAMAFCVSMIESFPFAVKVILGVVVYGAAAVSFDLVDVDALKRFLPKVRRRKEKPL